MTNYKLWEFLSDTLSNKDVTPARIPKTTILRKERRLVKRRKRRKGAKRTSVSHRITTQQNVNRKINWEYS